MTRNELLFHEAHNHHCRLHFADNSELTGVYGAFFKNEPERIYLVSSPELISFKPLLEAQDTVAMRSYCKPIDPAQVIAVQLVS